MLTFTEQAGNVINLMAQLAPGATGIRLSGSCGSQPEHEVPPVLKIAMTFEFSLHDELMITPSGVAVFIEPQIAPILKGATLDGSIDSHGHPHFVACREEPAGQTWAWKNHFDQ